MLPSEDGQCSSRSDPRLNRSFCLFYGNLSGLFGFVQRHVDSLTYFQQILYVCDVLLSNVTQPQLSTPFYGDVEKLHLYVERISLITEFLLFRNHFKKKEKKEKKVKKEKMRKENKRQRQRQRKASIPAGCIKQRCIIQHMTPETQNMNCFGKFHVGIDRLSINQSNMVFSS